MKNLINIFKKNKSLKLRLFLDHNRNIYVGSNHMKIESYWKDKNNDSYIRGSFNREHYFQYLETKFNTKINYLF